VGVGIGRLDRALLRAQLGAPIEIVVVISGTFGKDRGEEVDIRPDSVGTRPEPRRKALWKVAGGRMQRAVETAIVLLEDVTVGGRSLRADIDDVETTSRRDVETQFEGCHRRL
jgi:hypothetical protein